MKKNSMPKDKHWEMRYSMHKPNATMKASQGADFMPKCPEDRKSTHLKVNKQDH